MRDRVRGPRSLKAKVKGEQELEIFIYIFIHINKELHYEEY